MSQTKPNALEFAPELDHFGRDNGNNSDMTKYKSLAYEYFGETDENRQEAIHQFREKLESEDPHLLKSLPGTVEDNFLLKVLRAGTASGKQAKTSYCNKMHFDGIAEKSNTTDHKKLTFQENLKNLMLPMLQSC